ncbi:hypothetical protein M434DRAFT_36940 [Hypoxylon sp. CO27-5]|nr:hypothetical protein M434DRAFT_36940 [Hypoxylon sp. CO27-5]
MSNQKDKSESLRDPNAPKPSLPLRLSRPGPIARLLRTNSVPPPNYRPLPKLNYIEDWLPSLEIQLPPRLRYLRGGLIYCPPVKAAPRWLPRPGYGRQETELRFCDTRGLDDKFPFPLKDYTSGELGSVPDDVLAQVITDWRRTPVISFRPDTRNVVSRISPDLVAKWGPDVCPGEADAMWISDGKPMGMDDHIPPVRRIIKDPVTKYFIIIMDYIWGGYNLVDIWHRRSKEQQGRIAAKVTSLVKFMQDYTSRYPGPAGFSRCRTLVHKKYPVPLGMTPEKYDEYMNLLVNELNARRPRKFYDNFVKTGKFVYSNMKLDPSSFVLDKKGCLWVLGWSKGGFFPKEGELALAERYMPESYAILVKTLLKRIPHDKSLRDTLRAIATLIDEDLIGKPPK